MTLLPQAPLTPGPWRYDRMDTERGHFLDGYLVSKSDPDDPVSGIAFITDHHDGFSREADARLISAAHEMLTAIKMAFLYTPVGSEASIAIRAALTKVEGRHE